jgi:dienelactone hydrolase
MRSLVVAGGIVALGIMGLARFAGGEEPAAPARRTETKLVESKDGDVTLKGLAVYDPTLSSLRPVVIVIHDWWGQGEFAKATAERMAQRGYVGFAADMYGNAKLVNDPKEAGALSSACRADDCLIGRRRAKLAYEAVKALPFVDKERIAVLGFCFGGTMSLELAYTNTPVRGAISFHGNPVAPREGDSWTADLLVLHGADDPFVPAEALTAFQAAMRKDKGEYELVQYSGALHSFTDPGVDKHNLEGAKYDARAATRAFARCEAFLKEVFAR